MFGLTGARLRWTVARPAGSRQGVEIVEISQAGGRPLTRRITDAGAMTLVMSTSEPLTNASPGYQSTAERRSARAAGRIRLAPTSS
jgi:hypothetical protein